jgi:nickel-dependent lactate racemase
MMTPGAAWVASFALAMESFSLVASVLDFDVDLAGHLRSAGAKLMEVQCAAPPSELRPYANGELREAVVAALDEPLEFPPLARCTVPGDQVAIAVDESVPRLAEITAGVIEAFARTGTEPADIRIVTADGSCAELLEAQLPELGHANVQVVRHDPNRDNDLCYVGVMHNGETLLVNRTLYDADVVFPIGCTRLDNALGSAGMFDCLYPRFTDAETLSRWRRADVAHAKRQAAWRRDADEAGWLLGAVMLLEVVPGPRGSVAHVVAGEARAVGRASLERCRELWAGHVPHSASLVVVTLFNGRERQSWENVARAMEAAARVLGPDGALAICCSELDPPGKSLRRLAAADSPDDVLRQLGRDAEPDTWSAWQLAQARLRGPVYLLGGLAADTAEELGMAPIGDLDELARLASRHESCVVLEGSHQRVTTPNA